MLQRDMWSTIVTLNPVVLEDTMVVLDIMVQSNYMVTRYIDPKIFPTNTSGLRVNMVDHMFLRCYGLSLLDINQTSRGHGMTK